MKENTPEISAFVQSDIGETADLSNTTNTVRDMIRSGEWGKRDIDEKTNVNPQAPRRTPREKFLCDFEILRRGLRGDELSQAEQETLVREFTYNFMSYIQELSGVERQQLLSTGIKILEKLYDSMEIPIPDHFGTLRKIAEGKVESNITMHLISLATREIRNTIAQNALQQKHEKTHVT